MASQPGAKKGTSDRRNGRPKPSPIAIRRSLAACLRAMLNPISFSR